MVSPTVLKLHKAAPIVFPLHPTVNQGGIVRMAVRLDPTTCRRFHSVAGMTHQFLPRPPSALSRKNYEGNIPGSFTAAPLRPPPSSPPIAPPQRSEEWFVLRQDKLTASSFSTALGFWKGNRRSALWHQKVFAPRSDNLEEAAREAVNWGVANEIAAIERYRSMTGNEVGFLGFAAHADAGSGWLGASPDGLVGCHPDAGILEVKCPYNRGRPELGSPWKAAPYYYMPQVQGQMEIMDREWVDLYCWMPNGSVLFRVIRDREYWGLMHGMLRDFWWGSVVPAREAVAAEDVAAAKCYEPEARHEMTGRMVGMSLKMAEKAAVVWRDVGGRVEFFR